MGYKAKTEVAALDYDFAPFASEVKGVTPEPEFKRVKDYFEGFGHLLRSNATLMREWQTKLDEIEGTDAPAVQQRSELDARFEEWQSENTDITKAERVRLMAEVCQQQPSYDDLMALPGRVFDDFEQYMQGELSPLGRKSGTS